MRSFPYYLRVFQAYLGSGTSQLSFWHEQPALNARAFDPGSLQYFMTFHDKSEYAGPFDAEGIPLLDYRGSLGRQYNPIAIAQYGLACGNRRDENERFNRQFLMCADWLVRNLKPNPHGVASWMHTFNWEYFRTLVAPWYSGLAQGQGVSLLVRAYRATNQRAYLDAATTALKSLGTPIDQGGVLFKDAEGDWWIEEYITDPPTHILNGFLWASWGVWDYLQLPAQSNTSEIKDWWERFVATLEHHLGKFDNGYWSLYDRSPVRYPNVASPFYHRLHIVQLDVMHRLTGRAVFRKMHDRWQAYQVRGWNRRKALMQKALFKLFYF